MISLGKKKHAMKVKIYESSEKRIREKRGEAKEMEEEGKED